MATKPNGRAMTGEEFLAQLHEDQIDCITPADRRRQAREALPLVTGFMSRPAGRTFRDLVLHGEEREYFERLAILWYWRIQATPKTYETSNQEDDALGILHLFTGGCDWYLTELEAGMEPAAEDFQWQATGYTDIGWGLEAEYICIPEICSAGAELDLHWKPTPVWKIKLAHKE